MFSDDELFGSPDRIALARRTANLWWLLRANPRNAYHGRAVALSDPGQDTADILAAMAKLHGAAGAYFYPASGAKSLLARPEERGLATDRHEHFWGGEAALAASRRALEDFSLPADLSTSAIDAGTPRGLVGDVAALCQSCDVMPVPGSVMRWQARTGICLVATDQDRRPAATASSYMIHHPSSPRAKDASWGMLATREDRRGERIALLLGAGNHSHVGPPWHARLHDRREGRQFTVAGPLQTARRERNRPDIRRLLRQGDVRRIVDNKVAFPAVRHRPRYSA